MLAWVRLSAGLWVPAGRGAVSSSCVFVPVSTIVPIFQAGPETFCLTPFAQESLRFLFFFHPKLGQTDRFLQLWDRWMSAFVAWHRACSPYRGPSFVHPHPTWVGQGLGQRSSNLGPTPAEYIPWCSAKHLNIFSLSLIQHLGFHFLNPPSSWKKNSLSFHPSVHAKSPQSCLTLCNPMDLAGQAPLSMRFSRQEYWSGLPCPPPGHLPDPEIIPASLASPALAGRFFTTSATWEAPYPSCGYLKYFTQYLTSKSRIHWSLQLLEQENETGIFFSQLFLRGFHFTYSLVFQFHLFEGNPSQSL